ncbi:SurA N-terminal domain-containing protein [Glaciimonas sp. CA11.2]|uniref:SurA N-terminal domain-containing protein n=1 Tax=Glaciimonas sp. CA11.2 TaxID=3048601 RepID=UPI002AB549C9|nr:SurA N-terminal domain-containing protein [Glaciimonas sp. CA11.2]MDY7547853.1 SurA N-terminal domain-containing protein [Glaciimonas sp. CA11.2]MEB0164481.1 SurA N-terminal domain-containing protein [Glaciimonas sp. CA11.2]
MFEFIRSHQRLMQFMLLLLIIPSFALVGLQSYTSFGDSANAVAKVAGQSITQQELDAAQRQQMDRMRQMFGAQFDAKMFDTPQAKQGVLENLIAQRAQLAAVAREHLMVSDLTLQQTLLGIPELHGADGKFDNEKYRSLLAAQGTVPKMYEAGLRQDLALQQLAGAIESTAFAPKSLALRFSNISDQERDTQELLFKTADYASQVKVTDEMLKAYYDKNGQQFEIPEQVKAEYIVLDSAAVAAQVTVNDADVKSYYEQNLARYSTQEQRRASHILITTNKDASAADKAVAKTKAESLLAQLRKDPAEFAKLAKENSQDTASAEHGGDLGYFGDGMMVKPFSDAALKLKQGEISNVVESDFGYHIIQLTGIKPAEVKPLAQVKDEISAEIKKQLATKKFAEMADAFNDTVYEQANSLQPAADKLKLSIQTVSNVGRHPNPALAPTVLYNNEKFLTALFADGSVKNKRNTAAIEVAPSTLIAGHVISYKPVTKQAFEDVKELVRTKVIQAAEVELAEKAGAAKFAALKVKDDTAGFAVAKTVSRANQQGVAPNVFDAVMKADVSKLPAFVGVSLPGQGYAIYRIGKVAQPATIDQARRQSEQKQISSALAQQEMSAYVEVLKKKAKAKILKPIVASAPVDDNLASK